ncbi:uncharacterized protein TNCV_4504671 [Trichonephila clavipes]|nr:uncharacterized protein TNCV_4504671 [Trichonephila clavipes]
MLYLLLVALFLGTALGEDAHMGTVFAVTGCRATCLDQHALFVRNEVSCKENLNCNALPGCRTACKFLSNSSFPSKNDQLMSLTVKSKFDFRAMRFTLEWIPKYNRSNSTILYTVLIRGEGIEWQQIAQTVSHIVYLKGYLMDRTTSIRVLAANSTHQIAFVETNYVKSSILSTGKRVYVSKKDWSPQLVSMVWSDTSTGILATITWPSIPDELGPNEYEVSWNALGDPMEVTGHLQTSKNTVVLTLWPDSTYLVTVERYTSNDIVYGDVSQTLIINTNEAVNQTFVETKSLENVFPFVKEKTKVPPQVQEKTIRVINPSMVGIHFTKTSDAPSQCTLHV